MGTPDNLQSAVASGDYVGAFRALTTALAGRFEVAEDRDAASLARVLAASLDRLMELAPLVVAATPLDEMQARRERRAA